MYGHVYWEDHALDQWTEWRFWSTLFFGQIYLRLTNTFGSWVTKGYENLMILLDVGEGPETSAGTLLRPFAPLTTRLTPSPTGQVDTSHLSTCGKSRQQKSSPELKIVPFQKPKTRHGQRNHVLLEHHSHFHSFPDCRWLTRPSATALLRADRARPCSLRDCRRQLAAMALWNPPAARGPPGTVEKLRFWGLGWCMVIWRFP